MYLVKIKFSSEFNSKDYLWAIARVGKDRFDCEDFQNIVCQMNGKGLNTPILSEQSSTWGQIKNAATIKALRTVGDPIILFEQVHAFREILVFAYAQGILTNPEGKLMAELKSAATKQQPKKQRVSLTMEDALGGVRPADDPRYAVDNSAGNHPAGNSHAVADNSAAGSSVKLIFLTRITE